MVRPRLIRGMGILGYSVISSQGEPSWSKQRFLAARVGTLAQALYTSWQLTKSGPSGQLPHTSSTLASPPQADTETSSPTTEILIKFKTIPPPTGSWIERASSKPSEFRGIDERENVAPNGVSARKTVVDSRNRTADSSLFIGCPNICRSMPIPSHARSENRSPGAHQPQRQRTQFVGSNSDVELSRGLCPRCADDRPAWVARPLGASGDGATRPSVVAGAFESCA